MASTTIFLDGVGFLSLNKKLVATLSDLTLNYEVSTDEVTSFSDAFQKNRIATFKDWSVDGSAFVDSATAVPSSMTTFTGATTFTGSTATLDLIALAQAGAAVSMTIKLASGKFYRGNALITKVSAKGSVGKAETFSISLQAAGTLTISAT
jgi:predicted secreted protein